MFFKTATELSLRTDHLHIWFPKHAVMATGKRGKFSSFTLFKNKIKVSLFNSYDTSSSSNFFSELKTAFSRKVRKICYSHQQFKKQNAPNPSC